MKDIISKLNLPDDVMRVVCQVVDGVRLTVDDAMVLMEGAPLAVLGMLATARKREVSGVDVYYNRNFHIEPTNICMFNCKFCSYRRDNGSDEAWYYDLGTIREMCERYVGKPVTEVHIVGGVHPQHTLQDYCRMIEVVREVLPQVSIKAYSAVELYHVISKAGLSLAEGLTRLQAAGMTAIPGGGAEIFDPSIRGEICPDKPDAEQWLETHRVAHGLGISTNATILYGHVEGYRHRFEHMLQLRDLQDETGGFNAFIPLKYRAANNAMSQVGEVALTEDMKMLAMSRLFLDNIQHIKAYWVMLGLQTTELALSFGADDIDGTIDDTTKIYSMAGAELQHPRMDTAQMEAMIRRAGYEPVERDTFYRAVVR